MSCAHESLDDDGDDKERKETEKSKRKEREEKHMPYFGYLQFNAAFVTVAVQNPSKITKTKVSQIVWAVYWFSLSPSVFRSSRGLFHCPSLSVTSPVIKFHIKIFISFKIALTLHNWNFMMYANGVNVCVCVLWSPTKCSPFFHTINHSAFRNDFCNSLDLCNNKCIKYITGEF